MGFGISIAVDTITLVVLGFKRLGSFPT